MSRLIRLLALFIGLLVGASGGALVWLPAGGHQVAAGLTARDVPDQSLATTTPVTPSDGLSPSPTTTAAPAATTATTAAVTPWAAALDAALSSGPSCLSVEDDSGRPIFGHQPTTALVPASTQKLLVAAAALAVLGPDFRFKTSVVAKSAPVAGEVAALWLVGDGDPLLSTPEFVSNEVGRLRVAGYPWTPLAALADALATAGVRRVPGGIAGDDSFLDRVRFLAVWPQSYQVDMEIGLLSALSVNEGLSTLTPTPMLAKDPPGFAASELARLLGQRQVTTGPSGGDQVAPAGGVVLASVASAPLSEIVKAMLRASDNWIAELLVRQIDRATGGTGTTAGGLAVVMRQAALLGISLAGVHMDDGSGLSHTDRATCDELLSALDLGWKPAFSAMGDGLAIAGATGTLALRYRGTSIAGKLRAKTGSLDNAGGMVGVVSVGAPVRFALLINQTKSEAKLLAQEDQVVTILAAYVPGGVSH